MKKLYDVQENHAEVLAKALENFRSTLDGSKTGTGKTIVASTLSARAGIPTLVVCPQSAIPMWNRELKEQGCNVLGVINYEKLRTGKTPYGSWADAFNRIWMWSLPDTETLIVWDEVQKCRGMNTQNARMLWNAKPYFNLCLSATAAKDPTDMKALGSILGLFSLRNFWFWAKQHGCRNGYFGGLEFSGEDADIDKLHKAVFPMHGSRLSIADMKKHFQETEIITTPLDFGKELLEVYEEMATELAVLAERKKEDNSSAEALTIRLRARQKVELLKVPTIIEMTEDLYEEGRSIVVFVNFDATLEALRERFEEQYPVGIISGKYVKQRQQFIDNFANDKLRVMLCNIQAGGISVNLHDTRGLHPRVSIISPSDNAMDVLQCIGRIHRAGGATPSQQFILFAAGTIEEKVKENCDEKIRNIHVFNEGIVDNSKSCDNCK